MSAKSQILVVDDEADIRELLEITLSRMGIRCCAAATLGEAHAWLAEKTFDFCITDMRLPDGNGIDLVRKVQAEHSRLPIAVITAHGNAQAAVESLKAGAFDFVSKPVDLRVLRKLVETARRWASPRPRRRRTIGRPRCSPLRGRPRSERSPRAYRRAGPPPAGPPGPCRAR
jgi:two-component system response regulator PilR (NtrC family)